MKNNEKKLWDIRDHDQYNTKFNINDKEFTLRNNGTPVLKLRMGRNIKEIPDFTVKCLILNQIWDNHAKWKKDLNPVEHRKNLVFFVKINILTLKNKMTNFFSCNFSL